MKRRIFTVAMLLVTPATALAQTVSPPPDPPPAPIVEPAPPPAPAPAPAPDPTPPREALEVRVIGSRPDSLQRIPGSGTVITSQDIKRADPYDVSEMLRRVPGVTVRQDAESGARLDISIRGLDGGRSRHILVLEDGIPIGVNPYAEPDLLYAPPIERMRGMEVVKGSGSILFGPQTIGGVVNFLTLAPEAREHLRLDAEGGQRGYTRALAQYGNAIGSARYVTQAFFKRGDGFRDQAFDTTDVFGKLAFDTSSKGEATFKLGFHDESAYADDVGLTRAMYAADPRQPSLAPNDRMHQRRYEASLIQEQRFSTETKLRTLIYAYSTTRTWRRQAFNRSAYDPNALPPGAAVGTQPPGFDYFVGDPSIPGGGLYFAKTDTIQGRVYEVAGIEPRLEHRMTTGSVGHTIDLGGRLLGETAHYEQHTGSLPDSDSGSLDSEENHRTVAVAGYLQDRIALRDDLMVTPGVRFEHAEFHKMVLRQTTGIDAQGKPVSSDVNVPGDFGKSGFMPGLGMIFGSRDAHVFTGTHIGWAPPRIASSFSPKGVPTQVSAEYSYNYEIGTRVFYKKWLRSEATGFYSRFTNQVVSGDSPDGSSLMDGGPTQHVGGELGTTAMIGKALRWPTAVDLGARYTFARATFVGGQYDKNLLPYAPLHNVSMNLDVEHPFAGGSAVGGQIAYSHLSAQFSDSANTVAENTTGEYGRIPAPNIVDATAHYHHQPTGLTLRLTVKNALDDVYIAGRRPQGIAVSGFRQIMVGLRWDWEAKDKSAAE